MQMTAAEAKEHAADLEMHLTDGEIIGKKHRSGEKKRFQRKATQMRVTKRIPDQGRRQRGRRRECQKRQ